MPTMDDDISLPAIQPRPAMIAVLIETFAESAESVETGKPFPVTTADMLDVVGAFEAIIRSMAQGGPVKVRGS
jgi:hypothetical protein